MFYLPRKKLCLLNNMCNLLLGSVCVLHDLSVLVLFMGNIMVVYVTVTEGLLSGSTILDVCH